MSSVFFADPQRSPELEDCDYVWDNAKGGEEEFLRAVESFAGILIRWECGIKAIDKTGRYSFCYLVEGGECVSDESNSGEGSGTIVEGTLVWEERRRIQKIFEEKILLLRQNVDPESLAREIIDNIVKSNKVFRIASVTERDLYDIIIQKLEELAGDELVSKYDWSAYTLVREYLGDLIAEATQKADLQYQRLVAEKLREIAKECVSWARKRGYRKIRKSLIGLCLADIGVYLPERYRNMLWELVRGK